MVNLPPAVLNRFPDMLSGGEQQRVAVARAMSMGSGLLLADEPTGNIDSENGVDLLVSILLDLAHQRNDCVIVVTHDMELAAQADCTLRNDRRHSKGSLIRKKPQAVSATDCGFLIAAKRWFSDLVTERGPAGAV